MVCLLLSTLLAYVFGTRMINENPELDINPATLAMTMLLLPYTFLQLGIWTGCGAWLFSGFIGGAINENYKSAFLMSILVLVCYYSVGFLLTGPYAIEYFVTIDITTLLSDSITMLVMTFVGALVGAWVSIRRLKKEKNII